MSRAPQAPYGRAQADPPPQYGLDADSARQDAVARPVGRREAQTPDPCLVCSPRTR
jgi:hypothetical protein